MYCHDFPVKLWLLNGKSTSFLIPFFPPPVCGHPSTLDMFYDQVTPVRKLDDVVADTRPVQCRGLGKLEQQQPALWCQVLGGVEDRNYWTEGGWQRELAHWEQTDVAILKKYTTSELNMKSGGRRERRTLFVSAPRFVVCRQLVSCCDEKPVISSKKYAGFSKRSWGP